MAKYSDLSLIVKETWAVENGNKIAFLILGKPGGGKSALSMDVVAQMGGTEENTVVFTPSLRDPVDVLGTPNNLGVCTEWKPPKEFYKLRDTPDDAPRFLIIEELTDSTIPMMNAMCRIVLDRMAGDLKLHHNLFIIGTGNRTEDKSGANRLTTKLGNRLNVLEFDENLDDWCDWALKKGLDRVLIQFVRFKPNLLSDFRADVPYGINPTPRSWEKVAYIPTDMRSDLYYTCISGLVGQGAAVEYTAFRKIHHGLIRAEDVVKDPVHAPLPKELAQRFALVGSLSAHTTKDNVDKIAKYIDRLPADFSVMYWLDTMKTIPAIKTSKAFISWATSQSNIVLGR